MQIRKWGYWHDDGAGLLLGVLGQFPEVRYDRPENEMSLFAEWMQARSLQVLCDGPS